MDKPTPTVPPWTYWYLFTPGIEIEEIQKVGLKPIDLLSTQLQAQYAGHGKTPAQYFRERYEMFYRKAVGKPYVHYGIYTTPIDLRGHRDIHARVRFDASTLKPLISHLHSNAYAKRKAQLHTSTWKPELHQQMVEAFHKEVVDEVMRSVTERVFRFLPQYVYFGDVPLMFTMDQVEKF